jgi:hypothetical protein
MTAFVVANQLLEQLHSCSEYMAMEHNISQNKD